MRIAINVFTGIFFDNRNAFSGITVILFITIVTNAKDDITTFDRTNALIVAGNVETGIFSGFVLNTGCEIISIDMITIIADTSSSVAIFDSANSMVAAFY